MKDPLTDTVGNQIDGNGDGVPGGNWWSDFVVEALSQTLISPSPDPFNFETEYAGFGAGQLVQGTNNAFDGLNRLQVGGAVFAIGYHDSWRSTCST